jgi:hypothetical protein
MDYDAILEQVVALLQREKRLSYRVLKRRLQLDDETVEDLKEDLIYAKQLAVDEDGKVLVWTERASTTWAPATSRQPEQPDNRADQPTARDSPGRHHVRLRPNAVSSPCYFVTWWTRPCSPASSTRRSGASWCGPIKRRAPR